MNELVPAVQGEWRLWMHECGHVELWENGTAPEDGGCDACESGSDRAADWRPLFVESKSAHNADYDVPPRPTEAEYGSLPILDPTQLPHNAKSADDVVTHLPCRWCRATVGHNVGCMAYGE